MSDWLTAAEREFFDLLDEMPQRRAGGSILSVRPAKQAEFRSRKARFPRLELRKARLALLTALFEKGQR